MEETVSLQKNKKRLATKRRIFWIRMVFLPTLLDRKAIRWYKKIRIKKKIAKDKDIKDIIPREFDSIVYYQY